jgi:hypothetical protein
MSDQQLVTGLSIVISGYSQLNCGISLYDWNMITKLAWFSSATHLATLLFLREYLRRNRGIWYMRVLLMTGLAVMLAVAIAPTGVSQATRHSEAPKIPEIPAKCAFTSIDSYEHVRADSGSQGSMILSEILLLGGLSIRLIEMSSIIERFSGSSLKTYIGKIWRKSLFLSCEKLQSSRRWVQIVFIPLVLFSLTYLISMQALLDFFKTDLCGVSNHSVTTIAF